MIGFLCLSYLQWPSQAPKSSRVPISITYALHAVAWARNFFLNFWSEMSVAITTIRIVFSSTQRMTSLLPSTMPSVYFCEVISFLTASIVLFMVCSSTSSSGRAPLSEPLGGRLFSQLKHTLALLKHTAALLPNLLGPLLASGSLPWDQVIIIPFF